MLDFLSGCWGSERATDVREGSGEYGVIAEYMPKNMGDVRATVTIRSHMAGHPIESIEMARVIMTLSGEVVVMWVNAVPDDIRKGAMEKLRGLVINIMRAFPEAVKRHQEKKPLEHYCRVSVGEVEFGNDTNPNMEGIEASVDVFIVAKDDSEKENGEEQKGGQSIATLGLTKGGDIVVLVFDEDAAEFGNDLEPVISRAHEKLEALCNW